MTPAGPTAPAVPDATTPMLAARHVGVRFGGLTALDDVSIAVPVGAKVGLVGPNGAGKSTLFAVLSGFQRPNSGSIEMMGRDITELPPEARAHLGLSRSFQHPELFRSLTVAEHLVLAYRISRHRRRLWSDLLDMKGWRRPDAAETARVKEIVALLGLTRVAGRHADGLPTGLARLVEVGRAIAAFPKVLLLDEPAAGLDSHETRELGSVLDRVVAEEGVSLLLVEHDLDFVLRTVEKVYVLHFGKLLAEGNPDQIRANQDVQEAYLGMAAAAKGDGAS
jgi:ABC-type branched-subunit amino acid transport system ATPase component